MREGSVHLLRWARQLAGSQPRRVAAARRGEQSQERLGQGAGVTGVTQPGCRCRRGHPAGMQVSQGSPSRRTSPGGKGHVFPE